ncbi:MAG: GTP-binding protein [Candidatus Lokiarchaeota archaeon]|nr:GTP-binding protein [Candidatus Lokiarchaeota archaeon]
METHKVIIVGPSAVGKTSLLNRFVHDEFVLRYKMTIGVDFLTKIIEYQPSKSVKLHIWDIGGQERFKFLHRSFYDGAAGALILFDLSRQHTFSSMKTWLSEMRNIMDKEIPKVIIGNKIDLIPEIGRIIEKSEVENYAKSENCFYMETSAKTGENVEKAFLELTQCMLGNGKTKI